MRCPKCGSRDIDFVEAGAQSICVSCGIVLEESAIVSSIEFAEVGDRSHVVGHYVAANCNKLASALRLPPLYVDRAYRLYQLALLSHFSSGRRQMHIAATCLYVVCRQERSPFLLIDFSDVLQINVYVLGKAFLQFTRVLHTNLPIVDPSLYIHRYASRFQFGDQLQSIITASLRIVTRLKKDWIAMGRRPDNVCAAALLIAARAHDHELAIEEVADLFHISTETIKRRLQEFKLTPSAQLTLQQLHGVDTNVEYDPPAFIRSLLAQNDHVNLCLEETDESGELPPLLSVEELENDDVFHALHPDLDAGAAKPTKARVVTTKLGNVEVAVPVPHKQTQRSNSARQTERTVLYGNIYHEILQQQQHQQPPQQLETEAFAPAVLFASGESSLCQDGVNHPNPLAQDARSCVLNTQALLQEAQQMPQRIRQRPRKGLGAAVITCTIGGSSKTQGSAAAADVITITDEISPLTEIEAQHYLFTDEERQKREVIWQRTFGDFMAERHRRKREREQQSQEAGEQYTQTGKLRKKYVRKKAAEAKTTSEAVVNSSKSIKGASKKINYEALKGAFGEDGDLAVPAPNSSSVATAMSTAIKSAATAAKPRGQAKARNAAVAAASVEAMAPTPTANKDSKAAAPATVSAPAAPMEGEEEEDDEEEEEDAPLISAGAQDYDYDDEYY